MWRREIGCDTASILASESSTQLNPELRAMDYDTFLVKDEFHKNPDGEGANHEGCAARRDC